MAKKLMDIKATNFIVNPKAVSANRLYLSEAESHHLTKVLRAKKGDIFYAIDGQGGRYRAVIDSIAPRRVAAEIISSTRLANEPFLQVTLAVGLSRPSRLDYVVEKGTEIGISRFIFFASEKSLGENDPTDKAIKKLRRWRKLAESATKQSLRTLIPDISEPVDFAAILASRRNFDIALTADMNGQAELSAGTFDRAKRRVLLLIGPESGFTDSEVESAAAAGFSPVRLGPRRLRVETAAIVFASLVMAAAGEL